MLSISRSGAVSALLASLCFGVSTAVVSIIKQPMLVAVLIAGGVLVLTLMARPSNVVRTLREHPKTFLIIGGLEALNISTFYAALSIGPVPVVTAVHLTAPIMLLLTSVAQGRRAWSYVVAMEVVVVVFALVIGALKPGGQFTTVDVLIGCALALFSAVMVCVMFVAISSHGSKSGVLESAASQFTVVLVLLSPLLLFKPHEVSVTDIGVLFVVGATVWSLGLILMWRSLRMVDPSTTSVVMLNEAVTATLIVAVAVGGVSWLSAVSGALILCVVAAELLLPEPSDTVGLNRA